MLIGGSAAWTRTKDPLVNSEMLYQLSYRGIFFHAVRSELSPACRQAGTAEYIP